MFERFSFFASGQNLKITDSRAAVSDETAHTRRIRLNIFIGNDKDITAFKVLRNKISYSEQQRMANENIIGSCIQIDRNDFCFHAFFAYKTASNLIDIQIFIQCFYQRLMGPLLAPGIHFEMNVRLRIERMAVLHQGFQFFLGIICL